MNERQSFLSIPVVGLLLTTVLGFLLSFVLITRWLWPVEWTDASTRNLSPEAQAEYLRMVIGSYALRPDADLATARYYDLGPAAEDTLAAVQLDPGYLSPNDVAAFSAVVGVAGPVPAAPEAPVSQVWVVIGLFFGLLFAAIVIYYLYAYWRSRQAEKEVQAFTLEDEHEFQPAPWETDTVVGFPEETRFEPIEDEGVPLEETTSAADELGEMPEAESGGPGMLGAAALGAGLVGAAALAADQAEDEAAVEQEQEEVLPAEFLEEPTEEDALPDWLADFDFGTEGEQGGGGLGAALGAGAVGAGLAAAAMMDEDEEPTAGEAALEDELGAQAASLDMDLPDWLAEFEAEAEEELPTLEEELPTLEEELPPVEEGPQPLEEIAKFRASLEFVEGIGPAYATRLAEIGIGTPLALLEVGATPRGRERIVEQTGISHKLVLNWVNQVDMYRIKGIGSEFAQLLEASGVDTVVELATRNPENLFARMGEVNAEKNLVRQLPTLANVADWINQAKTLPRMIQY